MRDELFILISMIVIWNLLFCLVLHMLLGGLIKIGLLLFMIFL